MYLNVRWYIVKKRIIVDLAYNYAERDFNWF